MENDVRILEHWFNLFVKLNWNIYILTPLRYISLSGFSFDCFLKLSKVELDTMQVEQMLKDFISAVRDGICDAMGKRQMKNVESRQFLYFDANNLFGYALMPKLF